jgi:hypothetical protein
MVGRSVGGRLAVSVIVWATRLAARQRRELGCHQARCQPGDNPDAESASGPSTLNEDQIAERGARLARRDE